MREVAIDRAIYIADNGSKTYRFGRRNPDWEKLSSSQKKRNKKSIDGYTRIFPDGRTKVFRFKG